MTEEKSELNVKIKGKIRDLLAFSKLTKKRKKKIDKAPAEPIKKDPINSLAQEIHPDYQYLKIDKIKEETKSSKTFTLVPDADSETTVLSNFRAGQYISLNVNVNGYDITRPYTISSSPTDALQGFYEITIRKEENGFLTNHIWENWKQGTKVISSGPQGFFYYQPPRDTQQLVGIAGGSGITAFRSIAREIAEGKLNINLTILYGCSEEDDIIFYDELKELEKANPKKIKLVVVLSCEEVTLKGCETGFITSDLIEKYVDLDKSTFFICGPQVMYDFIDEEIEKLNIPKERIRKEVYGEIKDASTLPGFPKEKAEKVYKIKVKIGGETKEIPAKATESILVSMERAKLAPPSLCRSGECGFCRSYLISGDIFVNPKTEARREAEKQFNFIHPCSSYPLSDLEIAVPRAK